MNILIGTIATIAVALSGWVYFNDTYGGVNLLGAISYPTSLDSFTNPSATDKTSSPSHSTQHSNANDALEALEAKVGISGSAVTTSHDYKLSGVTGSDLACSLTGSETLTNKTLTSPIITGPTISWEISASSTLTGTTSILTSGRPMSLDLGSDTTGDIFYRNSSGYLTRLGVGTNGQFLKLNSGLPAWETSTGGLDIDVYNSTSSTYAAVNSISFDVDDIFTVWASFNWPTCDSDTATDFRGDLQYKTSFMAATKTIETVGDATSQSEACNAVAIGTYTATTTGTMNYRATEKEGSSIVSIIVQHIIK